MSARIVIILTIIFISLQTINSCDYNIIWDRDFCNTTDHGRLESSILPPNILNSVCEFEIGSNITLDHTNRDIYENLYRVYNRYDFSNCSASNTSSNFLLINASYTFTLDIADYTIGEEVYFISTSNGSKFSAENHKKTETPCLQFVFKVVQVRNTCDTCNSTIFDSVDNNNFGCPVTMDLLIIIYIGVPLFIVILVGCCLAVFLFSQKSAKKLIQRSMNQQEVTGDTSI